MIPLLRSVLVGPPNHASNGTARGGITTSLQQTPGQPRLAGIFANPDAEAGLRDARRLAAQLKSTHPDAVGSLLEGLEEMFTVARLGITGALRRSLTNTNCIESMISTVRVVTGRVKTWKDGEMKKRWIATGMIEAQRSFRRVRGHTQMANLVTVIGHAVTPANYAQAVA